MREDTFVREKPAKMLIVLRTAEQTNTPNTIIGLAKASGMSFVHASNLLNELEAGGLVKSAKTGRTKRITLTPKGAEVSHALEDLISKLHKQEGNEAAPQPTPTAPAPSPKAEFPQPPPQSKKPEEPQEEEKKE